MKTIKIKHFYSLPLLETLLALIGLPLCISFVISKNPALIAIGIFLLLIVIVACVFFFNYGITISPKAIVLMDQDMLKIFPYEDVIYIKIVFHNDSIEGEVKARGQKPFTFCFTGTHPRGLIFLGYIFSTSGVKITKKFVDKSIERLSHCEKVKIKNLYTEK